VNKSSLIENEEFHKRNTRIKISPRELKEADNEKFSENAFFQESDDEETGFSIILHFSD